MLLLGSYTPVSVPHSLSRLTNLKVSKPTNMNLVQTDQHEGRLHPPTLTITRPTSILTLVLFLDLLLFPIISSQRSCRLPWVQGAYSYFTNWIENNEITCIITCLSLLICETQPKTTAGADRELTKYTVNI